MHFIKKPWFIPTLFTLIILPVGGFFIGSLINKKEPIAADDIRSRLESMYGGAVDRIFTSGRRIFNFEMTRGRTNYEAEIDTTTRIISAMRYSNR